VLQRTAVSEQRVIYATVDLRTGNTWYVSLGDGPFIWLFGLVFAASVLLSRRTDDEPDVQPGEATT
jgi:apolipoprotein N-acyltransferase